MRFPIAVIFQRTLLANRWVSERWEPVAIVPPESDAPEAGVPVRISDDATGSRWRFDGHTLELHRSEAEGYYLNITAPEPKVFVMWRDRDDGGDPPVFPVVVTVSYNQAARMLDGGERVDAVPLPAAILAWMQPYVTEHYKPEPKKKLRRNDPFVDGAFRGERGPRS
jgi:hypothetical protein